MKCYDMNCRFDSNTNSNNRPSEQGNVYLVLMKNREHFYLFTINHSVTLLSHRTKSGNVVVLCTDDVIANSN
jgi:hypothetical protein